MSHTHLLSHIPRQPSFRLTVPQAQVSIAAFLLLHNESEFIPEPSSPTPTLGSMLYALLADKCPASGSHPSDVCTLPVFGICAFFMRLRCVHCFSILGCVHFS